MGRRSEFTLLVILGIAAVAVVVLVWGQQTGKFTILGDSFLPAATTGAPIVITPAVQQPVLFVETFATTLANDVSVTTADWNNDAGNVVIPAGNIEAKAQSLTFAKTTGSVSVTLDVESDVPSGSYIYYGISSDGGKTWQAILPGQRLAVHDAGGDWRWRADLQRGTANYSPVLNRISIALSPVA